jgi:hypothetical protein
MIKSIIDGRNRKNDIEGIDHFYSAARKYVQFLNLNTKDVGIIA